MNMDWDKVMVWAAWSCEKVIPSANLAGPSSEISHLDLRRAMKQSFSAAEEVVENMLLTWTLKMIMPVTGSMSSTGFITIQREIRPRDPDQIMEECTYCQGPPHSPTKCPVIIQGAWSSPLQRQTSPTSIPKPKENPALPKYPNCP